MESKNKLFSKKRIISFIIILILFLLVDFVSLLFNDGEDSLIRNFVGYESNYSSHHLSSSYSYIYPTWNYHKLYISIISIYLIAVLCLIFKWAYNGSKYDTKEYKNITKNDIKFSFIVSTFLSVAIIISAFCVSNNPYAGKSEAYKNIDILINNYRNKELDYNEIQICLMHIDRFSGSNKLNYKINYNGTNIEKDDVNMISRQEKYRIYKSGDDLPVSIYIENY